MPHLFSIKLARCGVEFFVQKPPNAPKQKLAAVNKAIEDETNILRIFVDKISRLVDIAKTLA
ncbi:MAG: hypothetical protein LBK73_10555 [Treponema sp.]|jgi:hypothetical protein|nr:hypothetical protein [Treponema sp.]